jgi:hypothetical protein
LKLCVLLIGGGVLALALTLPACSSRPAPVSAAAQTPRTPKPADTNDRRVIPEPAAPALPRAGGTFRDPAFGTEVMRVTDERDGKLNGTFYPHWPTLNADSTRLLVKRYDTGDAVYSFDPVNFKLGASRLIPRLRRSRERTPSFAGARRPPRIVTGLFVVILSASIRPFL